MRQEDTQICWICLGSASDPSPFIGDINHHDSEYIIEEKLQVAIENHLIANGDKNIDESLQEFINDRLDVNENNISIWSRTINTIRSLCPYNKNEDNETSLISIECPQCSYPIFAKSTNNILINSACDTRSFLLEIFGYLLILLTMIVGGYQYYFSSYFVVSKWGSDVLNTIFPKNYFPKLGKMLRDDFLNMLKHQGQMV